MIYILFGSAEVRIFPLFSIVFGNDIVIVISYHCVSKLAYFVAHDIGYQPFKFQCSRMSRSNFMEGVGTPQCYNEIKKLSAKRVKQRDYPKAKSNKAESHILFKTSF